MTRVVLRPIEPGNSAFCASCSQPVKFRCYADAGHPHGEVAA